MSIAPLKLSGLKGLSAEDRKLIESAEAMIGEELEASGPIKSFCRGQARAELAFPYPETAGRPAQIFNRHQPELEPDHRRRISPGRSCPNKTQLTNYPK